MRALWVLDPQGRLIADTDPVKPGTDLSDRDYFTAFRQQSDRGFYLGAPVRSRSTGTWLISAAYPVDDANGALAAIVVAALEPPYFEKLWGAIDFGAGGQIDLYRADGILMASSLRNNPRIGQRQHDPAIALALARGAAATSHGRDVLVVAQPLGMYPQITLTARRSLGELLQQWRRYALIMAAAWLVLSLMVVTLFVMRRRSWAQRSAAIDALHSSERKFAAAFRASPDAIMITRAADGVFVEISDSVSRMTGFTREELIGHSSVEHDLWADPDARQRYIGLMRSHGRVANLEARFRIRSGEQRIGEMSGELIDIEGQPHMLGIIRDVTEHRRREELIWQQANFDTLTGLPNRRMFLDRLAGRIKSRRCTAAARPAVHRPGPVQGSQRHAGPREGRRPAGAERRARIQRWLRARRRRHALARLGGDEFAVILPDAGRRAAVDHVAQDDPRLPRWQPFSLGLEQAFISASIGVAFCIRTTAPKWTSCCATPTRPCTRPSGAGRNRYCYFTPSLQDAAHERAVR